MASDEIPPLPWEALKEAGEALPWAALEQIAEAVATDEEALRLLEKAYFESEPYEVASYEGLFTPAILAMAAPRMSETVRRRAVAFVVEELAGVGGTSLNEIAEGTFQRAAGLLVESW